MNILIVEDDVPIAQALEAQLPLHGFTVHRAETLAAAMECAEERSFQAMILDLRLPDGQRLASASWDKTARWVLDQAPAGWVSTTRSGAGLVMRRSHLEAWAG